MCKKTDAVLRFIDCEDVEIPEFFESLWDFICIPENERDPKGLGYVTGASEVRKVWGVKNYGDYTGLRATYLKNPEQGTGRTMTIIKGGWSMKFSHHTNDGKYKIILPLTRAEAFKMGE